MSFSESQQRVLASLPKISSVFSLFGSLWIIIEVTTEKQKRQVPYHRLLFAMSVYDALESVWNFGSTWPIPEGSPGAVWAIGNSGTCTAQGFFLTLSVAVPMYNAMLSLYYVLVINYNYTDKRLRNFVEPIMHTVAFVWAFGTALYSALAGLLNFATLWCWIAPVPYDCLDSWTHGTAEEGNPNPCIRGDNVWVYRFCFYFIPLWICIGFATICHYLIYRFVYARDKATLQYRRPELSNIWKAMQGVRFRAASAIKDAILHNSTGSRPHSKDPTGTQGTKDGSNMTSERPCPSKTNSSGDFSISCYDDSNAPLCMEESMGRIETGRDAWALAMKGSENNHVHSSSLDDSLQSIDNENEEQEDEPPSPDMMFTIDEQAETTKEEQSKVKRNVGRKFKKWRRKRERFAEDMPHTTEVFHQACFYLGAFYCTHIWSTSNRIVQTIIDSGDTVFTLNALHSFFDPFQGFLNFLVYQRPRYLQIRRANPEMGRLRAIRQTIRFSCNTAKNIGQRSSLQIRTDASTNLNISGEESRWSFAASEASSSWRAGEAGGCETKSATLSNGGLKRHESWTENDPVAEK